MHGLKDITKTRRNVVLLGDLQWVSGIAPGVETRGRKLESSGSNQRGMEVVQGLLYPQPGLQLKGGVRFRLAG